MTTYFLGLDCAAQHHDFGLALGSSDSSGLTIHEVTTGKADVLPVVSRWIREYQPAVLAFDAPLGWPETLGNTLIGHSAGGQVPDDSNELFLRTTDIYVWRKLKKRPLEVGTDKIARAAATALRVANLIRKETCQELPLLWEPMIPKQPGIIEVYPAATLIARSLSERGYKGTKPVHRKARELLIQSLSNLMSFKGDIELMASSDDTLDAVICVLAANDFVNGQVHRPEDSSLAKKEGWIWFSE